jgi:hypothetical protein
MRSAGQAVPTRIVLLAGAGSVDEPEEHPTRAGYLGAIRIAPSRRTVWPFR